MKVVEVSINNSRRTYDYILDSNMDVYEDDLVFVEGISFPVYVRRVLNKEKSLANKKVMSKAIENEKVKSYIKYSNVVNYKADACINLVSETCNFNMISEVLIRSMTESERYPLIHAIDAGKPFDLFLTDILSLNYKKVIHIKVPKKEKDYFNNNLINAYIKAIDKAIDLGYKSIVLPQVYNKISDYSANEIYDAINLVINKYKYTCDIDVEFINLISDVNYNDVKRTISHESLDKENTKIIHKNCTTDNLDLDDFLVEVTGSYDNAIDYNKCSPNKGEDINLRRLKYDVAYFYELVKEKFINENMFNEYSPEDETKIVPYKFADDYAIAYRIRDKEEGCYYTSNMVRNMRIGKRQIDLYDVVRTAIFLEMDFTVTRQFMNVSGLEFKPFSPYDRDLIIFMYMYKYDGFKKGMKHFNEKIVKMTDYANNLFDVLWNGIED